MPSRPQTDAHREAIDLVQSARQVPYEDLVREVVPLDASDLEMFLETGPARTGPSLKHIRAIHHMVALRLASGEKHIQIASAMSLSMGTVSRLSQDPQLLELVSAYRGKMVNKAIDHFSLMECVAGEVLGEMHERLLDPDQRSEISFEGLRRVAVDLVDRVGHSPVRRSESTSHHRVSLHTDEVTRIKQIYSGETRFEGRLGTSPPIIDATIVERHEEESARAGAAESLAAVFQSAPADEEDELDAGKGSGV